MPERETRQDSLHWAKADGSVPIKVKGRPVHIASTPFKLSEAEVIKGLYGPPAWSVRLGRIERWEAEAQAAIDRAWAEAKVEFASADARLRALERAIARLNLGGVNDLIERHNAYFPIEANLPIDYLTGLPRHGDDVFKPRPARTARGLLAEARARLET